MGQTYYGKNFLFLLSSKILGGTKNHIVSTAALACMMSDSLKDPYSQPCKDLYFKL